MTLTPWTYTEISDLLDHTDISHLLDADTTRLLSASNQPTPKAPPAGTGPVGPGRPADDAANMAALWQHIRDREQERAATPAAPLPAAAPTVQPIPAWAKTTALLAPTVGGGIAVAAVGLSAAAPGLIAVSHVLWSAVAAIAVGGTAAAVVIGRVRARITAAQRPHITQNITATGWFGRANGTINHR
ncbi:hypothetical protein ACWGQL_16330 [Streptomyces lydicus]